MSNGLHLHTDLEADAQLGPLQVLLEIKGSIDSLCEKVERQNRLLEARKRLVPMHYDAVGSAVAANTVAIIDLSSGGLPSTGRRWEVRRWIVGGTGVATAAGQAWLLATGVATNLITSAATVPIGDVCDASPTGGSLPYGNQFGTRQIFVEDNERLAVAVIGATNGATYVAAASVDDIDEQTDIFNQAVTL